MFRNKMIRQAIMLSAAVLSVSPLALSNVSLRNGNFFIGYTDIFYPGGFEPKVERVYNSKSPYTEGMFGAGWGTEYEVHLVVSADGSVVVHEYGGGAENRFVPTEFKKADLTRAVKAISVEAKKAGVVGTAKQVADYEKKLTSDAVFRNAEWQKFVDQKKLQARKLKAGTQLISNQFSYQFITKLKDGYKRSFDNGKIETFNEEGKLVRVSDKNNNFISITYNKASQIVRIIDNFNRKIYFEYNSQGLVSQISGENKKKATYQYNKLKELVESNDVDGNKYKYDYSNDRRHNLTQIVYSDGTKMQIDYYGREQKENVKQVTDRDGTITAYTYQEDGKDKGHLTVGTQVKTKAGRSISKASYEYFTKVKSTGDTWTYKMVTNIDGDRTETVYNECCGLPIMIKRGKDVTQFKYDKKGHVVQKSTPTEVTQLAYHKKFGKVTRVQRYSKLTKKKSWSRFAYDGKGNLDTAKNSDKRLVKLFYDKNGRIRSMVDQDRRRIDFKYNENSKPIEIRDPKLGAIQVTYNNSGEIKRVDSSAGRRIALQVTSAFQNLLDIIRPAGVSLSF